MADETTVTSSTGWGGRLKGSLVSAVFGLLMFVAAFVVLWKNEGRTVHTAASLGKAGKQVIELAAPKVEATHEGHLVHFSGPAAAATPAADTVFGLRLDALRIERKVEMFQWIEKKDSKTQDKVGGGTETVTTYRYERTWEDSRIDSSQFKTTAGHENPALPYASESFTARPVMVGDFTLGDGFLPRIGSAQPVTLSEGMLASIPSDLKRYGTRIAENRVVTCDPAAPQVGDVRVSWTFVPNRTLVSVIGGQKGNGVGIHVIGEVDVSRLENGTVSASTMLAHAKKENKTLAWILRLVGLLLMWFGLRLALSPVAMALAFLPFLKRLAELGIGIITFLLALALSLVTIALAWFYYRPVLSIILLVVAVGAIGGMVYYRKKKASAGVPAA